MTNLNTLIDQFIGEEVGKEKTIFERPKDELERIFGYNQALQDLKSRKQELIDGIVNKLSKLQKFELVVLDNRLVDQKNYNLVLEDIIKELTDKFDK